MKIFISTTTFAEFCSKPLDLLRKNKIDFTLNPHKRKLSEKEISEILISGGYDGLIAGTEPLTKRVLLKAGGLKVISRLGVGLDNIDLVTAKKLKIKVFNTPDVLIDSVAELTVGLILCCLRKIALMDRNIRQKTWKKEMGFLFKDKVLGIVGLGKIGKRVAILSKAFKAKIIFYDLKDIKTTFARRVTLDNLIENSDVISIHSSSTSSLISKEEIRKMKPGVILVNTSRGEIIDESALYDGLVSGKVAFAALDVFSREPYGGKLLGLDNVILTPHIGSYAREARMKMEIEAINNLLKVLGNNVK